jgi:precorrin-6B methylase 2
MRDSVRYVGDLSKSDALLLIQYGEKARKILEFGAGASTQIFAQVCPLKVVSMETDAAWVKRTEANLSALKQENFVRFVPWGEIPKDEYNLVFVDGRWDLREEFAFKAWPFLAKNGVMIIHDTRRWYDADLANKIFKENYAEISTIKVNEKPFYGENPSNCTVICKRDPVLYENWNEVEEKEPWMWGDGEPKEPEYWPRV